MYLKTCTTGNQHALGKEKEKGKKDQSDKKKTITFAQKSVGAFRFDPPTTLHGETHKGCSKILLAK